VSLAGIIATGQVYAAAWSPPLTLAILVGIALGAVILDPALLAPRWHGPRLGLLEARLVPALLVAGMALLFLRAMPAAGELVGGVALGTAAGILTIVAGMTALVAFVGTGSVAALYAAALLFAAGLPSVVPRGPGVSEASVGGVAYALAFAFVGSLRLGRAGGVGWQAVASGLFALTAGVSAVGPTAVVFLPVVQLGVAVAVLVRGRRWSGAPLAPAGPHPGPRATPQRRERGAAAAPVKRRPMPLKPSAARVADAPAAESPPETLPAGALIADPSPVEAPPVEPPPLESPKAPAPRRRQRSTESKHAPESNRDRGGSGAPEG
jgi:hypothetical protein